MIRSSDDITNLKMELKYHFSKWDTSYYLIKLFIENNSNSNNNSI